MFVWFCISEVFVFSGSLPGIEGLVDRNRWWTISALRLWAAGYAEGTRSSDEEAESGNSEGQIPALKANAQVRGRTERTDSKRRLCITVLS